MGAVADRFGLGRVRSAQRVATGLMNRNWQVTTGTGVYAVKEVRDVDPVRARRQHVAVAALAARGCPVLPPLRTDDGDTLAEVDGRAYAAVPWVNGQHRPGTSLTVGEAGNLGRVLAGLHVALGQVMSPAPRVVVSAVAEPARAKATIDRYEAVIAGRDQLDAMDQFVAAELARRRALLERVAYLRPPDDVSVVPAWCHGDFQHLNLVYQAGVVVAVLDWDRLAVRPVAAEVVRSATLLFGSARGRLDLERVVAFTGGYRAVMPVADADMADTAHRLWWERVCDFWQLARRYEHHDTSCDHLFRSASALLWWWTAHRDAVSEAFTR